MQWLSILHTIAKGVKGKGRLYIIYEQDIVCLPKWFGKELIQAPFTRKRFGVVTFSSSESCFRFWCVYTETFLCLYDDEGAIKMATSNSAATMDQTANGKERNAKTKEGTVSVKGKERTAKEKDGATKAKEQAFVWTDDEVELLLKVTHEYKVKKAGENVDWESVRSKYSDIWEQLKRELPSDSEEARETGKDFPHKTEDITKQAVTTKLKAVRLTYRQAVDSGRKSGHGRVVLLYFEWCERIWGGGGHQQPNKSPVELKQLT